MLNLPTIRRSTLPTLNARYRRDGEQPQVEDEGAAVVRAVARMARGAGQGGEVEPEEFDRSAGASHTNVNPGVVQGGTAPERPLSVINPALLANPKAERGAAGWYGTPENPARTHGAPLNPPLASLNAQAEPPALHKDLIPNPPPIVTPAERRGLRPLPVMRNAEGESITRPQYDDTGSEREDLANYGRALQMYRNPADKDGRRWSALKRAALGFVQGVAQTGSLAGGLGGAITGGVYGAARPNWNERAERDAEQARVDSRLKSVDEQTKRAFDIERTRKEFEQESALREEELKNKRLLPVLKERESSQGRDEAERAGLRQTWNNLQEFDPNSSDPEIRAMVERARSLNLFLPKKTREAAADWELTKVGDRTVLHNRRTNEIKEATLNGQPIDPKEAKPLSAADLPDSFFELPDEKAIVDAALAEVAPSVKGRRIKPEILAGYRTVKGKDNVTTKVNFANPDGSPNMDEIWRAIELEVLSPSEVWENVTQEDDQRLAEARKRIRTRASSERAAVDEFRLRVTRNKPNANAVATPVANVARRFNEIRRTPAGKQREQALKTFYDTLPYLRIE